MTAPRHPDPEPRTRPAQSGRTVIPALRVADLAAGVLGLAGMVATYPLRCLAADTAPEGRRAAITFFEYEAHLKSARAAATAGRVTHGR